MNLKETKELLSLVFTIVEAGEAAVANGSVGLGDVGELMKILPKLGPAFDKIQNVPKELSSLDKASADELVAWAKQDLDLESDSIEAMIEKGLSVVAGLADLLGLLKKS